MTTTSIGVQELRKRIGVKAKAGCRWAGWSAGAVYGDWGLFSSYRVAWVQCGQRQGHITLRAESAGSAGWRKSPCPVRRAGAGSTGHGLG